VRVHALVLAAGQGRRFGGDKLLASFQGRPLLSYVLDVVVTGCSRGLLGGGHVVVGSQDGRARTLCEEAGLEPVLNGAPHLGLSHSLRLGLTTLANRTDDDVPAALVFLGDQPLVRLDVIEKLLAGWRKGIQAVVRPRYQRSPERPGHPALLDRSIWTYAHQLQGDRGFAALFPSALIPTVTIDVPGDNPDVDTRADLHALEEPSP
jgi:molybdenum cofactor cytidylyltransferase